MRRYSEDEIQSVLIQHRPVAEVEYEDNGPEAFCRCGLYPPMGWPMDHHDWRRTYVPFDTEHLLEALANARRKR